MRRRKNAAYTHRSGIEHGFETFTSQVGIVFSSSRELAVRLQGRGVPRIRTVLVDQANPESKFIAQIPNNSC